MDTQIQNKSDNLPIVIARSDSESSNIHKSVSVTNTNLDEIPKLRNQNTTMNNETESVLESSSTSVPSDIVSFPIEVTTIVQSKGSSNLKMMSDIDLTNYSANIHKNGSLLTNETADVGVFGTKSVNDSNGSSKENDYKKNNKLDFKETISAGSVPVITNHMDLINKSKLTIDETFKCEIGALFLLLFSAIIESVSGYYISYKSVVAFAFGIIFLGLEGMSFINMFLSEKAGRPPFVSTSIIWGYLAFFCLGPNGIYYDINIPYIYPWSSLGVIPYFISGFFWSLAGLIQRKNNTRKALGIFVWCLSCIILVGMLIGLYYFIQNIVFPIIYPELPKKEVLDLSNAIGTLLMCIISIILVLLSILHNKRIFKSAHIIIYMSICIQTLPFALVVGIPFVLIEYIIMCCSGCCGSGIAQNKCCKSVFNIFKRWGLFDAKKAAEL